MNTTRKELRMMDDYGMLGDLGRELLARRIPFQYDYTGGNIWVMTIGDPEDYHLLVDERGCACVYPLQDDSEASSALNCGTDYDHTAEDVRHTADTIQRHLEEVGA